MITIISCEDAAHKSDGLQFAYKSVMSTIQCASVVTETINDYLRVNLYVSFTLLRKRNVCPLYLGFLMYSYCNQRMRVRWNSTNSGDVLLSNGVKQGGYYRHCYSRYI